MHTSITFFGVVLRIVGSVLGLIAFAGIASMFFGRIPITPATVLADAGAWFLAYASFFGSFGLIRYGWARASQIGRNIFMTLFGVPIGILCAYIGLGAWGFFNEFPQLDPVHTLDNVAVDWSTKIVGTVGIVAGIALLGWCFFGWRELFRDRTQNQLQPC